MRGNQEEAKTFVNFASVVVKIVLTDEKKEYDKKPYKYFHYIRFLAFFLFISPYSCPICRA
jgi:hypothetical protein